MNKKKFRVPRDLKFSRKKSGHAVSGAIVHSREGLPIVSDKVFMVGNKVKDIFLKLKKNE